MHGHRVVTVIIDKEGTISASTLDIQCRIAMSCSFTFYEKSTVTPEQYKSVPVRTPKEQQLTSSWKHPT